MRENRAFEYDVPYVYDRVTTKSNKQHEILREYGYEIRKYSDAAAKSMDDRPFGKEFAQAQKKRAMPHRQESGGRTIRTDGGGYIYRPGKQNGYGYGKASVAAAKTLPLKLVMDKVINLFETIEDRANNDERIAKQRAIMSKKWSENKNNFLTALFLVIITVIVFAAIYKLCFVVRNIDVYGVESYSAEEVVESSGIELGENLYSFKSSAAESEITFECPMIKNAVVTRTVPKTVNITVEEDTPVFYANIWGDWMMMSSNLRVLGNTTEKEAKEKSLIKLVLPVIKYSVAGRQVEFVDSKASKLVYGVIETVRLSSAGQAGEITAIDLTDEYNINMEAEDIYTLKFGGESDLELKLRMLHKTITSGSLEKGNPATIDLTTVGEACVRYSLNDKT